jgi:hypothetical protein
MARKRLGKREKELIAALKEQGFAIKEVGDGYQALAPDGVGCVTFHLTEGDHRAMKNTVARLRRHGFEWKGR